MQKWWRRSPSAPRTMGSVQVTSQVRAVSPCNVTSCSLHSAMRWTLITLCIIRGNCVLQKDWGCQPTIEARLNQWVTNENRLCNCLTGNAIREKGKRLLGEVNAMLREGEHILLNFTSGWLWKFQGRCNLKCRKLHGEAGNSDDAAVEVKLPKMMRLC